MRVASFNVENLDEGGGSGNPVLALRAPVLRAALERLCADVLCLQEVHGQELPQHTSDRPRRVLRALDTVLEGTRYAAFERACTMTTDGTPYDQRNLVVLSAYPIIVATQYRNDLIDTLQYRKVTARPPEPAADALRWERPILHAELAHPVFGTLHVINVHLKSRLASSVSGQSSGFRWKSAAGWAEGYFMSSMKRVGQALETRILVDRIFDADAQARILVCGDFNAGPGEVPVEAICGRVENTNNPALRERVLLSCSLRIPESVRFSHYHLGHGNLLDHILVSQALLPHFRDAQLHNENLHDESLPFSFETLFPESDHAPFVAQFDEPG